MYQALYRVYRPQSFDDMVGQELISQTLANAVATQKISHAYLFSGPRGTGKTSASKIFAKAINCPNQQNGQPCNVCDTCQAITNGALADVIEIDAASNNGVDEIRDIRDKSRYAPTQAKYKVYIIDEVHMLTTGAFNALLKTLEEPTQNVVFILATTEIHKVPATILSRVQQFTFKRINDTAIIERLKYVLNTENIHYEADAIALIAKIAKGGLRDALSLLDQSIAYDQTGVTLSTVLEVSGSVSETDLIDYLNAVHQHEADAAIQIVQQMLQNGKEVARFIEDLLFVSRDLLLKNTVESKEDALSNAFLYEVIAVLSETQQQMKQSLQHDLLIEVATIKLAQKTHIKNEIASDDVNGETVHAELFQLVSQLQQEVTQLKQQLEKGGISPTLETQTETAKKVVRQTKAYEVNLVKLFTILNAATHQDKQKVQDEWEDILSCLSTPHRAKLNASTIIAASAEGVVIGFEYPILCQMTAEDEVLQLELSKHAQRLIQHPFKIECVPHAQWQEYKNKFIVAKKNGTLNQYIAVEKSEQEQDDDTLFIEDEEKQQDELITTAVALFGDVVEVED